MSINATVDSTTYEGIQTIIVGGKTVSLSEVSSGSDTVSMATGSMTLTEDQNYIDITDLSFTPKAFAIRLTSPLNDAELTGAVMIFMDWGEGNRANTGGSNSFSGHTAWNCAGASGVSLTNCTVATALSTTAANTFQRTSSSFRVAKGASNGFPFKANHTYYWIALGWPDEE